MDEETQQCQGCFRDYPADDPMMEVGDSGAFCSWRCIAEYASDQEHCWTHEDLVEAYAAYARTLAKIFAKAEEEE